MDININEVIVNPGAERTILSNCINNSDIVIECQTEGLLPKNFGIEANKIIYSAIVYLFTRNANIDPISIQNVIKDDKARKVIEDIGGLEYIILLQESPITTNTKLFIDQIMQCYIRRRIYITCSELQDYVLNNAQQTQDELLGHVQEQTTQLVLESTKVNEAYKFGDKLGERLQEKADNPNEVPGLPSGFDKFDKATKGGQSGDLFIFAAESKTGKSVMLMNIASHQAIELGIPVLYIDSEQGNEEEEFRLLSIVSQIPEDELTTGLFMEDTGYGTAKDKVARIQEAQHKIKASQFFHVYMPDFTLEKINAITRKYYLKYGIQSLFFDYVDFNPTLLSQNKHLRDDMVLTNLTVGIKNLAKDLKIPAYSASQENRSGYGNTEKDAKNLGGSIGILQKATKLCFLRNKSEEELAMEGASKGNQKLLLKYQRHGPRDMSFNMFFDKKKITMHEV